MLEGRGAFIDVGWDRFEHPIIILAGERVPGEERYVAEALSFNEVKLTRVKPMSRPVLQGAPELVVGELLDLRHRYRALIPQDVR